MLATVLLHDGRATRVRCRPPRDRVAPVVGDRVEVDDREEILRIQPRERCLWRQAGKKWLTMASHVDRLLVVGAVDPPLKPGLLDRMLVAAEAEDIQAVVVVHKVDLPGRDEALLSVAPLRAVGHQVLATSVETGEGLAELAGLLARGLTVVAGHSGVGKSTLLNRLVPGAALRTGGVSAATGKGRHTTSVTTAHAVGADVWPQGGLLVDTPGVRAFGLGALSLDRIAHGFREFRSHLAGCRFRDCLHETEPACAVRAAAEKGEIDGERYRRYLRLLESVRRGEG
jgi:ribosome biogenesis GTPase